MANSTFTLRSVTLTQFRFSVGFTSTETTRLSRPGVEDGHLDVHTAPELLLSKLLLMWSLMSSDVGLTY